MVRIHLQSGGVERSECPRSVLSLLPDLNNLPESIASIQSTPHVAQSLLVSGAHIGDDAWNALTAATSSDIALADRSHDGPDSQVSIEGEEALQVHMQILANSFRVAIPATDSIHQLKGKRVDRCWRSNCGALVQTGHTSSGPEDISDTDNRGHVVRIAVEDDRGRIECRSSSLGIGHMHGGDEAKIVGGEVTIGYIRQGMSA